MKKTTKVLLTLVCAILLVASSILGTLAWLTDASAVKNTFTVGNIHFEDKNGLHGLDEADVNLDGQPIKDGKECKVEEAPRVVENTYKLVPGHKYTKDPTIHVAAGSEDCYLFVKVENPITKIEDGTGEYKTIADQMDALGWKKVMNGNTEVKDVYVLKVSKTEDGTTTWERKVVTTEKTAGTDVKVFDYFKLQDGLESVSEYENEAIKVTAYAIQVDGFAGKTDYEIWTAAGFADMKVETSSETNAPVTDTTEAA